MLSKVRSLAIKAEASEGVAETLAAADATLKVFDARFQPVVEFDDRMPNRATLTVLRSVAKEAFGEFSFSFEMKGEDGTVDSVPAWGKVNQGAGWKQVVTGATNVIWTPSDLLHTASEVPSYSVEGFVDGISRKMRGARVTSWALSMDSAGRLMCTVTMRGVLVGKTDVDTAVLVPVFSTELPPIWGQGTADISGLNLKVRTWTAELALESGPRWDPTFEHGVQSIRLNNRAPITGTIDPEFTLVATKSWRSIMQNNTVQDMKLILGTAGGRRITIDQNFAQFKQVGDADRDGDLIGDINYMLTGEENGAADEMQITKD